MEAIFWKGTKFARVTAGINPAYSQIIELADFVSKLREVL